MATLTIVEAVLDMDIERRSDESQLQYHKRIVYGKLVDKTLADIDYTELSELAYGQSYSSDVARRMFYGSRRTLQMMEEESSPRATNDALLFELDERIILLKKEQQKFYDQRAALNKIIRERSRQEELNDIIRDAVQNGDLPQLDYRPVEVAPSSNDILVSLNDIHYGMNVQNAWNTYNSDVCRDMMAHYLERVLAIAKTHGSENCIVYNCGDSLSGSIHLTVQIANKENVIEQVKGVSELIAEFLAALSLHFKTVRYISVAGNHSRLGSKDDSLYDERADDLVEWYVEARLQNFENIIIDTSSRIDETIFITDIRGKTYAGVHGDMDGSAQKIAALQAMAGRPLYAVLSGHMHHNMCDEVQGVKTIMAGSFLGMDDYCIQRRIYGKPEQMVCICDDTGIMCHYDVDLKIT